jgi:hypothetical protein
MFWKDSDLSLVFTNVTKDMKIVRNQFQLTFCEKTDAKYLRFGRKFLAQ